MQHIPCNNFKQYHIIDTLYKVSRKTIICLYIFIYYKHSFYFVQYYNRKIIKKDIKIYLNVI